MDFTDLEDLIRVISRISAKEHGVSVTPPSPILGFQPPGDGPHRVVEFTAPSAVLAGKWVRCHVWFDLSNIGSTDEIFASCEEAVRSMNDMEQMAQDMAAK